MDFLGPRLRGDDNIRGILAAKRHPDGSPTSRNRLRFRCTQLSTKEVGADLGVDYIV